MIKMIEMTYIISSFYWIPFVIFRTDMDKISKIIFFICYFIPFINIVSVAIHAANLTFYELYFRDWVIKLYHKFKK